MDRILNLLASLGYPVKVIKKDIEEEALLDDFTEEQLLAIEKLAAVERLKGSIEEAERFLPYDRAYALGRILDLEKKLEKLEKKFHMPKEKKESPSVIDVRIIRG